MTNTTNTSNTWLVFSTRIAGILIKQGHKIVDTLPNPKIPGKDMFLFEIDDTFSRDLQDAIEGGSRNGR